ncbi:MAG: flagellar biosynthesis protein P, partial [Nannocystaceae bacterium]|nr:flagellar biosynthesis protein P [Nannocystaceae bacterium]
MKRPAVFGSWGHVGVQTGLLLGLGFAVAGGAETPAYAGGDCPAAEACALKKPNLLLVVDYSSSMNQALTPTQTRWDATVGAIEGLVLADNGFFDERVHLGLLRYGHDPDPESEGTVIVEGGQAEASGLIDGHSIDAGWYDPLNDPSGYFECSGNQVLDALNTAGPPLCVGPSCEGIESWTAGALEAARDYIAQTRADHPQDTVPDDERGYFIVLITDGMWTTPMGNPPAPPFDLHDPVVVAGDLFSSDDVPTYVIALGEALGAGFADDTANAGGTVAALGAEDEDELEDALTVMVGDIDESTIGAPCLGQAPRIMVILDASSSMLNVDNPLDPGASQAGAMGTTGWDTVRQVLVDPPSFFGIQPAGLDGYTLEALAHVGLITFGSQGQQHLLTDYGPCVRQNFDWALDPDTSCGAGCADPWGGPPIIWSPQGPGSATYPGFDQETFSTMPECVVEVGVGGSGPCAGSATATHTGLALANANADQYRLDPPPTAPVSASTVFVNILITDGSYGNGGWSTDEQVAAELQDMYGNDNTTTFVVGFGEELEPTELANMACWGSGGTGVPCTGGSIAPLIAADESALRNALEQVSQTLEFDACCEPSSCLGAPQGTGSSTSGESGES